MSVPRRLNTVLPQQMRFDFEQQVVEDAAANMKQHIARAIAEEGTLPLADLVNAFRGTDYRWKKTRIVETLRELIHNNHILFENDGGTVKKREALRLLLDPADWHRIRVTHAPLVSRDQLAVSRELAAEMTGAEAPREQNLLCRLWRKRIRQWESCLRRFKPLADTGKYPGKGTIDEICAATESLLERHDPCRFIEAVNARGRLLLEYDALCAVLEHFYTEEIGVWQTMLEALETFEPNRQALAGDPRSQSSLAILDRTFRDSEPYGKLGNIAEHIVAVKRVNDDILERKTAAARDRASTEIAQMISRLAQALDDANAGPDLRNQALHPLQTAKKTIQRADSVRAVDGLLSVAADHKDLAMDAIGTSLHQNRHKKL